MILMSRGNLIMPAVAQKKPWVSCNLVSKEYSYNRTMNTKITAEIMRPTA